MLCGDEGRDEVVVFPINSTARERELISWLRGRPCYAVWQGSQ